MYFIETLYNKFPAGTEFQIPKDRYENVRKSFQIKMNEKTSTEYRIFNYAEIMALTGKTEDIAKSKKRSFWNNWMVQFIKPSTRRSLKCFVEVMYAQYLEY